jgi:hypothetical protein
MCELDLCYSTKEFGDANRVERPRKQVISHAGSGVDDGRIIAVKEVLHRRCTGLVDPLHVVENLQGIPVAQRYA